MSELREPIDALSSKGAMVYDSAFKGMLKTDYFLNDYWLDKEYTKILAKGRSATLKVRNNDMEKSWVLRQYYRGGLFGHIIERNYIYTKESSVRSVAEWRLLAKLYELGLSVPKPIAAIYWRSGFVYQAALLTEYIKNSVTLSEYLVTSEQPDWASIAITIKSIHKAGCVHGDLNAHNILLHGVNDVTIIDFDKSYISHSNQIKLHKVQKHNLYRLKRSILKVTNWSQDKLDTHWKEFMQAYTST